jgi:hypothetical protein
MMAQRAGFRGNRRVISQILREDPGVAEALDAIAGPVASESGGEIRKYTTDRQVVSISVPAEDQAVDGTVTRALGRQGLNPS